MSDPSYRAPAQRSNIHGNGDGLSGDVQLGSQCGVQKALIACVDPALPFRWREPRKPWVLSATGPSGTSGMTRG